MTAIPNNTSPLAEAEPPSESAQREFLRLWVQGHKAALDVLLDAYCIVDRSAKVVDFNIAFTELCGESYRKILKIAEFQKLLSCQTTEGTCPVQTILAKQKPLRIDELKGSSKAFATLGMIFAGAPILDAKGTLFGAVITIRNVSAETELQKKYEERKKESITDGLTGLFNKVYTESTLLRMVKGVLRDQVALSLVFCDIDHFKKVNDTYGHQAGDYVLAEVAHIMNDEARETDVVGRFGGEEFVGVLANTDHPGAIIFCDRFRKRIEATKFVFDGKTIPVTVSLGTASYKEVWKPGLNPEEEMKHLVHRADIALYNAKAKGRNQTCQYETLTEVEKKQGVPKK